MDKAAKQIMSVMVIISGIIAVGFRAERTS